MEAPLETPLLKIISFMQIINGYLIHADLHKAIQAGGLGCAGRGGVWRHALLSFSPHSCESLPPPPFPRAVQFTQLP